MAQKRTPGQGQNEPPEIEPDASTSVESDAAQHGDGGYKVGPGCPPKLPEHIKAAVLALVQSVANKEQAL